MKYPRLTIKSTGEFPSAKTMRVYLDDLEISNSLIHLSFEAGTNQPTVVFMRLKALIEVENIPVLVEPDNIGKIDNVPVA